MSSQAGETGDAGVVPVHPLVGAVESIAATLGDVAEVDPAYLRESDKDHLSRQLATCREQLEGLRLAVLAASDQVAYHHGARTAGQWGGHLARRDPRAGRADQRLLDALDRHHRVAAALRHGDLSRDHAETITRALDDLPDRVGPEVLARAEETLVAHARDCTPRQLRLVGRRILELVAPEVAEDEERRRLEDEERHAHEHTRLSLRDVGDGTTQVSGLIPTPAAQQLRALLAALHLPPPRPPRKRQDWHQQRRHRERERQQRRRWECGRVRRSGRVPPRRHPPNQRSA